MLALLVCCDSSRKGRYPDSRTIAKAIVPCNRKLPLWRSLLLRRVSDTGYCFVQGTLSICTTSLTHLYRYIKCLLVHCVLLCSIIFDYHVPDFSFWIHHFSFGIHAPTFGKHYFRLPHA